MTHQLHSYVDTKLFQMPDEHVSDADINGEGQEHPPQGRIVRSEGVDGAVDNLVQDVSCQGVLAERAKESELPVSYVRDQHEERVERQGETGRKKVKRHR